MPSLLIRAMTTRAMIHIVYSIFALYLMFSSASCSEDREGTKQTLEPREIKDVQSLPSHITNSIGIELLLVRGGQYFMGTDQEYFFGEKNVTRFGPQHLVELGPFYAGRREVTESEFREFRSSTGAENGSLDSLLTERPVVGVTWADAMAFCDWLSQKEERTYRLPTEAEWEFICRAGSTTDYWWGNDWDGGYRVAFRTGDPGEPFPGTVKPFGYFPMNAWGFYDLLGNANEWVYDWHDLDALTTYKASPRINPAGPKSGKRHVTRGGSIKAEPFPCSCVHRGTDSGRGAGFRIVLEINEHLKFEPLSEISELAKPFNSANDTAVRRVQLNENTEMAFVKVNSGKCIIGSPSSEFGGLRSPTEGPQTEVQIRQSFWIGQTEVTQAQFATVFPEIESPKVGPQLPAHGLPVYKKSFEFAELVTSRLRSSGQIADDEIVRLPSEIEWEFACRAGTDSAYSFGSDEKLIDHYGWVDVAGGPFEVGKKRPNGLGIFDMHGNVWEALSSKQFVYPGQAIDAQPPPTNYSSRLGFRGGAWAFPAHRSRSAARQFYVDKNYVGLRLVIVHASASVPQYREDMD